MIKLLEQFRSVKIEVRREWAIVASLTSSFQVLTPRPKGASYA